MTKDRKFYIFRGSKWTENQASEADIQYASKIAPMCM